MGTHRQNDSFGVKEIAALEVLSIRPGNLGTESPSWILSKPPIREVLKIRVQQAFTRLGHHSNGHLRLANAKWPPFCELIQKVAMSVTIRKKQRTANNISVDQVNYNKLPTVLDKGTGSKTRKRKNRIRGREKIPQWNLNWYFYGGIGKTPAEHKTEIKNEEHENYRPKCDDIEVLSEEFPWRIINNSGLAH